MRCIQTAFNQYVCGGSSLTRQLSHWGCCVRSEFVVGEVLHMKLPPIYIYIKISNMKPTNKYYVLSKYQVVYFVLVHSVLCDINQIIIRSDNSTGILWCETIPSLNYNSYMKIAFLHCFILHWCV